MWYSFFILVAFFITACGGSDAARTKDENISKPLPIPINLKREEFANPASLEKWSQVWKSEQWANSQLETLDIDTVRPGWLTMVPYSSGWFEDYRGVLMYQPIGGNFVATTSLEVRNKAGNGPPNVSYSLAGIMVRAPKTTTAATWVAGQEDYIFLSIGAADEPGEYQSEVKTTNNSVSVLEIESSPAGDAIIQTARIGEYFILLIKYPSQVWRVHRRYHRADMPAEVQVGLTAYTDWDTVQGVTPVFHNNNHLDGSPDLRAQFDYFYLDEPKVPESLVGADFSDSNVVTNEQILSFLGANL